MERKKANRVAKRKIASDCKQQRQADDDQLGKRSSGKTTKFGLGHFFVSWLPFTWLSRVLDSTRGLGKCILALGRSAKDCHRASPPSVAAVESPFLGLVDKLSPTKDQLLKTLFRRRDKDVTVDKAVELALEAYLRANASRDAEREIIVLRGPPGIGKSTYALGLLHDTSTAARLAHICSTDDFFTRIHSDGREVYCFNASKLGQNHGRNQERVRLCAAIGLSPIIVDNTNMTRQEMRPYIKIAHKAQYATRIVEPQDIHPQWNVMEFLQERNQNRLPPGKSISKAVLKGMLERFEPAEGHSLPSSHKHRKHKSTGRSHASPQRLCSASVARIPESLPEYIGIDLDKEFGGASGLSSGLWKTVSEMLQDDLAEPQMDVKKCIVPHPLHVTTFHCNDLKGLHAQDILLEARQAEGSLVMVTIEAVAIVVDGLACAIVSSVQPPVPVPERKLLHVTLAVRPPWRPVQSNDLLRAMLDGVNAEELQLQDGGVGTSSRYLDLSPLWRNGPVRIFERLSVSGRECRGIFVRLPQPLIMRGSRFRRR